MKKVKLDISGIAYSQTQSGSYVLTLAEVGGNRKLPIVIGGFEAQAIAVELEKLYVLEKAKPDEPATFGDILWNSWRTPQPAPKLPYLPEVGRFFTNQEWTFLEDLNNTVNPVLHSELDVGIDGKTREVVLPIQLSYLAATCQRIAKKAKVVNEVSDLIVKNEGSVSGGKKL